jgi:hypothetical protein
MTMSRVSAKVKKRRRVVLGRINPGAGGVSP